MRGFRQFSARRTKCHACHRICTLSPLDVALPLRCGKTSKSDTFKVLPCHENDDGHVQRAAAGRKLAHIFWQGRKSIAPATKKDFRQLPEHVWMSGSATPAMRNETTTRLKPPKRTTFAKLPIGAAIWPSRRRLRTFATVHATSSEHTLDPRPPKWNGNPC